MSPRSVEGAATERRRSKALARAYRRLGRAHRVELVGLLCQRYNGDLNEAEAIEKLAKAHGGANGLLGAAERWRAKTGNAKGHCVAAAAVDFINAGKGGKKLPSWFKS